MATQGYEVRGPNGERGWWDGKKITPLDGNGLQAGKISPQEQIQLKEARDASENAVSVLDDLTRFQDINKGVNTGGFGNALKNWFASANGDSRVQQLDEITARLAPQQRPSGSGTTSDMDLRLYLQSSPNKGSARAANNAIVERGRREAVLRQQRADFYDDWVAKHGSLTGAPAAFRAMIGLGSDRNPYSAEQAGDRTRLPRGAYYQSPEGVRRNDNGARGNPITTPAGRAPRTPGVRPGAVEDGYRFKGGDPSNPNSWERVR